MINGWISVMLIHRDNYMWKRFDLIIDGPLMEIKNKNPSMVSLSPSHSFQRRANRQRKKIERRQSNFWWKQFCPKLSWKRKTICHLVNLVLVSSRCRFSVQPDQAPQGQITFMVVNASQIGFWHVATTSVHILVWCLIFWWILPPQRNKDHPPP